MPKNNDKTFIRQHSPPSKNVALVIPPTAIMNEDLIRNMPPNLPDHVKNAIKQAPTDASNGRFSFSYVDAPINTKLLEDGAIHDDGVYSYPFRDAALGVFNLAAFSNDEFVWSFASSAQVCVLAAVKMGETSDVTFNTPLQEVLHVSKSYFPSGLSDTGYGTYPVHLCVDGLNPKGFRIVSSFEPEARRTNSRLPFFFGFRVFGKIKTDIEQPIWRHLLGEAIIQAGREAWQNALLNVAFAVESFIDNKLAKKLKGGGFAENYINHILRVGDRLHELHELNQSGINLSKNQVNKINENLNKYIFTPRNNLAHGKTKGSNLTGQAVANASRIAAEFIWDWGDKDERILLLTNMHLFDVSKLIDDQLLEACRN